MRDAEEDRDRGGLRGWLRGTPGDRARFDDMVRRLSASHLTGLTVGATTVLTAVHTGPAVLVTVVVAHVAMALGFAVARRRPDDRVTVAAASFVVLQLDMAFAVTLTGGGTSPLLPLVVVPVFSQAICFRPRVATAGMVLAAVLTTGGVAAAAALPAVPAVPSWLHLVGMLALMLTLAPASSCLAGADLASRDDAAVDELTGVYNRKALATRFESARARAERRRGTVGLVMLDLDHFKAVNDTHGHDRGDRVLQEVAARLQRATRADTPVYRLGGEEFLVVLPDASPEEARVVAERLRATVAAEPLAGLPVTVSVGVSSGPGQGLELGALLKAADEALYAAKAAGRDCVRVAGLPTAV